jgi:formate dehydrogenase subunit beta
MSQTASIPVPDGDLPAALSGFLQSILALDEIDALLVPRRLPMKNMVMPTLISDADQLDGVDPLAPAFAMNAAKVVSRLTRKPTGQKVAAVMRPCEIRAFIELVKLHQACTDDLVIVGLDCLGALGNTDYFDYAGTDGEAATHRFYRQVLELGDASSTPGPKLATACRVCELPIPEGADLLLGMFGVDVEHQILLDACTAAGEEVLQLLQLAPADVPQGRARALAALKQERTAARDQMFEDTRAATDNLEKLTAYLATCVNCYNCRVACPVCYCRECVFVTDVFDHEPSQYLGWAARKGAIKMPTDTIFYHLTRLAHMSTACVGCGQCSNACPNDIPVMELFRTVAHRTQQGFDYQAGRDLAETPPLSEFREDEFGEIVGIG